MTTNRRSRHVSALAGAALLLFVCPAMAQDGQWSPDSYRNGTYSAAPRSDYQPSTEGYSSGGGSSYGSGRADSYGSNSGGNGGYAANDGGGYGSDAYAPSRGGYEYGGGSGDSYAPSRDGYGVNDAYSPSRQGRNDSYSDPGRPVDDGGRGGYGEPYAPPQDERAYRDAPPPPSERGTYNQNEIIAAGHGFFGAISQGLGKAVEYAFQSQGRPNGYILGEDAGGAFVVGLRYGEGTLFTKDAGDHKVYWQGPSVGYDAGAEGSKTMVLVYNLHDPSDIYHRFGGVQGSAYFVGGLSVQFQTYGPITLALIRSGVGVRLGANVGYLKYTRSPTWNPL